jgi:uncharacterized membrane protein YeaQ/YmgE (transglycosylase-associated protein family)
LKMTTTVKAAAETFGYWFERFKGFENLNSSNYARRVAAANEAYRLWQASPYAKEAPVTTPIPTLPDPKPPSQTKREWGLWTVIAGLAGAAIAKWSGAPLSADVVTSLITNWGPVVVSGIGALIALIGQKKANAPITGTPLADIIKQVKDALERQGGGASSIPGVAQVAYPYQPEPVATPPDAFGLADQVRGLPVIELLSFAHQIGPVIDLAKRMGDDLRAADRAKIAAQPRDPLEVLKTSDEIPATAGIPGRPRAAS